LGNRETGTSRLEEALAAYQAAISGARGHSVKLQLAMTGIERVLVVLGERRAGG
jgi:exonuclease VII small subunit